MTYKGRVYLPTNSSLIPNIISSIHNSKHEGIQKTLYRVQADFYWQGMKASIREFIQNLFNLPAEQVGKSASRWPYTTSFNS